LTALLDRAEQRLASKPETAHFARLRQAFSPLEWHNACQRIIDLAVRLLRRAGPYKPQAYGFPKEDLDFAGLGPNGTWFEVHIEAPQLRLSGRMDVVEKSPQKIVVRDYNLGHVHDRQGNVLPHIEQQLRLYAQNDQFLAPSHAERIHAWAGGMDKRLIVFSEGNHNTIFAANRASYVRELEAFFQLTGIRALGPGPRKA
jgi:hypothetical protein